MNFVYFVLLQKMNYLNIFIYLDSLYIKNNLKALSEYRKNEF